MDPNKTLKDLREIVSLYNEGDADHWEIERAVELVEALDEWLSKGGFLPEAWSPEWDPNNED